MQRDRGLLESQTLQENKWNMSRTRLSSFEEVRQAFPLLSGIYVPPLSLSTVPLLQIHVIRLDTKGKQMLQRILN